ncbi:MAG: Na+/H+ antiporter NhaC [Moritella sp.]|uniref:Na+/H+ antiporter NhaC n=1 Tax=Moritella sp. TaxID=78556 RepID=UPI0025ED3BD3|nr:Na+/H+ antiporter NhaC [Moritella sp.]NQZ90971.1 Na+/H+ antiporter NhaC [Moritella sp.]
MKDTKKANLWQSILIITVVISIMVIPLMNGASLVIPLFIIWPILYLFMMIFKFDYKKAESDAFDSLRKTMSTLMIVASVGILVGAWIASGTIPTLIYYGLKMINPQYFLPITLIITSIMSIATGTSYGSAASVGIAMMGIGAAMGLDLGMVGGAVICGALFGDKMSPLSDTTNVCPAVTGGTLFTHIKTMLWTMVPAYIITLIIFLILGMQFDIGAYNADSVTSVTNIIDANFNVSFIALLPVITVIALLLLKVDTLPALFMGAISGLLVAVLYQGMNVVAVLDIMVKGFSIDTGDDFVDKLLNRGGLVSMAVTFFMILYSIVMGGMLESIGVMDALIGKVTKKVDTVFKLVVATMVTSYAAAIFTCSGNASHVLTGKMLSPLYKEKGIAPEVCSRTMEDCATLGGALIPWVNGIYFSGVLGISILDYVPYLFLTYLTPLFTLFFAATGIAIYYVDRKGKRITKEEHNKLYISPSPSLSLSPATTST